MGLLLVYPRIMFTWAPHSPAMVRCHLLSECTPRTRWGGHVLKFISFISV
ncbi:hypothetical protein E2C01_045753 [Portunus trituberculatus]|uniref:Uncharacterized protein n=1 Tax=Portunus trituberculatus TaxID=210409 RepID=A0A5B7G280_PORTR|nr:hypothetical protein [Portunus trituberculatus]